MKLKYTHKIIWFELSHNICCIKEVKTTVNLLPLHIKNLSRSKTISNLTVEML